MIDDESLATFEACRSMLTGVAYRVLGSMSDAADVVQDTYVAWSAARRDEVDNPRAWLTTVCTRRAIDAGRAAYRSRVDYVGPWLPDFVRTDDASDPEALAELDASVSVAFQLVLQRLSVRERAAFVLHDIFAVSYDDVAATLDTSADAARQLVSRARRHLRDPQLRAKPDPATTTRLLVAFRRALRSGSIDDLAALLAEPVTLSVDSGGKVAAIGHVVDGRDAVIDAFASVLVPYWLDHEIRDASFNAQPGLEVRDGEDLVAAVAFTVDEAGLVVRVDILRHPDKLRALRSL